MLPISPTESEAAYVLDGLFDQDTILDIQEHFTDRLDWVDHGVAEAQKHTKDRNFSRTSYGPVVLWASENSHAGEIVQVSL
ncbi:Tn3 family transposase [Bradyrhizobium diazoefficiens]|nr:Tn3 family transposase [Bradyrhizobium diazoefficiens]MBR0922810.1 Tn3 family transposase [Bradyrhizobium diazoefficiens]